MKQKLLGYIKIFMNPNSFGDLFPEFWTSMILSSNFSLGSYFAFVAKHLHE